MDTALAFFQAKRTLDGIVFHDSPLDRFPAIAGFNKINHASSGSFIPLTLENAFLSTHEGTSANFHV
jgi:hypothetical protein